VSTQVSVEAARECVSAVEAALQSLERLPEPERECAFNALTRVIDMYGLCLEHVLLRLEQPDSTVSPVMLAEDELIGHLLMLHELHPLGFRQPEDVPTLVQMGERRAAAKPVAKPVAEGVIAMLRGTATHSRAKSGLVCDLCAAFIGEQHRHLVDLEQREMRCVCRACSVLFDRRSAGGEHYRLVPDRLRRLTDFDLPAAIWQAFQIPVELAFLFYNSSAERVVAFYPGPMGATESLLEIERWAELTQRNPVLQKIEPDVEALLINRTGTPWQYWIVPVDVCYELVGVMRAHWKGLGGGQEVWEKIAEFFEHLSERAERETQYADT
jgi:hypothetical protein